MNLLDEQDHTVRDEHDPADEESDSCHRYPTPSCKGRVQVGICPQILRQQAEQGGDGHAGQRDVAVRCTDVVTNQHQVEDGRVDREVDVKRNGCCVLHAARRFRLDSVDRLDCYRHVPSQGLRCLQTFACRYDFVRRYYAIMQHKLQ